MSLETADKAIVGQQVKHHHYIMLISSIRFTSVFSKTLVGVCPVIFCMFAVVNVARRLQCQIQCVR